MGDWLNTEHGSMETCHVGDGKDYHVPNMRLKGNNYTRDDEQKVYMNVDR